MCKFAQVTRCVKMHKMCKDTRNVLSAQVQDVTVKYKCMHKFEATWAVGFGFHFTNSIQLFLVEQKKHDRKHAYNSVQFVVVYF